MESSRKLSGVAVLTLVAVLAGCAAGVTRHDDPLGGLAGGQDDARMGWLYESFSKELINELTGTDAK